jgi:type II secretory ATPase GspE/PulE/Tfp pilus assembly ATPase PilB-like protein
MKWYELKSQIEQKRMQEMQHQQKAQGKTAIQTMKDLFGRKETLEAGEFVMEIVRLGFQAGASDIHFQSEEKEIILRLRIDGVLHKIMTFTHKDFYKYSKKIKFLANTKMNVEHIPQDGRFTIQAIKSD